MRVALACPYAWDAPGGVQVHVGQLAARLRERGHEVLVLAPGGGPAHGATIVGRPIRVPFNGSVAPIAPWPSTARRVRGELDRFGPDVVHVHEPFVPGVSTAAVRHARAPVVATFHAFADRAWLLSAAAPLLRGLWRRLDVRLAVSGAAASFVARRFGREGIWIVPNGVETELFASASPAALPEGRRVLFVNRLDPRKGFSVMAEAFGLLAARREDVTLVVAGEGRERAAVARLEPGIRRRVVLLGGVRHEELPPYHAACEVFCAPATGRESFGIVLVEAMAAGLPVVASDIAGYREVVRDGVDGILVPPGNPAALARALERVLDEPALAEKLAAAGRERAQRYSWDRVTGLVEQAYRMATA